MQAIILQIVGLLIITTLIVLFYSKPNIETIETKTYAKLIGLNFSFSSTVYGDNASFINKLLLNTEPKPIVFLNNSYLSVRFDFRFEIDSSVSSSFVAYPASMVPRKAHPGFWKLNTLPLSAESGSSWLYMFTSMPRRRRTPLSSFGAVESASMADTDV